LHDSIQTTDIIPAIKTDHSAIKLVVGDNELNQVKDSGYWKMNCSILEDANYIEEISHLIPQWVSEGQKEMSDHRNVWEWIKFNVKATFHMIAAIATKKLNNPYDYKFPYDRYDRCDR